MEEVARIITQVVDHIRHDQRSEANQGEVFENPFQEIKLDFGYCTSDHEGH